MQFTTKCKTIRLKPDASGWTVAAGTSNVNSDIVDTAGYDSVRFIVGFGAIVSGAATSIKVQQGAASDMSDAADLAGTAQTVADTHDNKVVISEFYRPRERYMRVATLRATQNSTIDFAIAELFHAVRKESITQDTTVLGAEVFSSPAEGTA